jgi:hypothetical protein
MKQVSEKELFDIMDSYMSNWNDWPINGRMFFKKGFRIAEQKILEYSNKSLTESQLYDIMVKKGCWYSNEIQFLCIGFRKAEEYYR